MTPASRLHRTQGTPIHLKGWHLRLDPTGAVEVTDPNGRSRTSDPPGPIGWLSA